MLRFCHGCGYQYEATGTAVEPVCQRPPALCFQLSFHGANVLSDANVYSKRRSMHQWLCILTSLGLKVRKANAQLSSRRAQDGSRASSERPCFSPSPSPCRRRVVCRPHVSVVAFGCVGDWDHRDDRKRSKREGTLRLSLCSVWFLQTLKITEDSWSFNSSRSCYLCIASHLWFYGWS